MSEETQDIRVRNWTVVVYPESAPDNWRDILDDFHIEWVESPLHDKDINADGTPKKPHYHVLLMFSGKKSFEQVRKDICEEINCPIPKKVHNTKSLVRYMAHLDNPDKAQYDIREIKAHGGVDVADLLKPSSAERYTYIREMQTWCNEYSITEFEDLMNYASSERFDDWYPLLCDSCSYVMTQFLKSKRHNPKRSKVNVDIDTGEIIGD